jgi:lysophospholipase L1-like esterase
LYPFIPSLDAVEVESPAQPEVIVAFGDSITQQGEWTRRLAAKLLAVYQDRVVLINKGISGNRILRPGLGFSRLFGEAARDRLERDILSVPGVTTAIIALGSNDIGMSTPRGQNSVTSDQLTGALQAMADHLKERRIRTIGSTLLPWMGSPRYKPYHEVTRNEVNAWIRGCRGFYQVVDFDEAIRAKDDPRRMTAAYDCGDHLHPSSAGGEIMAKAAFDAYAASIR